MAEKPGEETVLGRGADEEMSEDSGYTGSGCSATTDMTGDTGSVCSATTDMTGDTGSVCSATTDMTGDTGSVCSATTDMTGDTGSVCSATTDMTGDTGSVCSATTDMTGDTGSVCSATTDMTGDTGSVCSATTDMTGDTGSVCSATTDMTGDTGSVCSATTDMTGDSGSVCSATTDKTLASKELQTKSGDSTNTATRNSNMAEKPGEETVLGRGADEEMSEDSGFTGSVCSATTDMTGDRGSVCRATTDKTLAFKEIQSESGDSTHTATRNFNMAEKPGEETVLGRGADEEMSEDSGFTGSVCSATTDKTLAFKEIQSESGDSTHTATRNSNMAEKPGEETVLGRGADEEMSEDSGFTGSVCSATTDMTGDRGSGCRATTDKNGYTGSVCSATTDKTLASKELQSESGDSTNTAVPEQASTGQGPAGTDALPWLPPDTADPASRTEQWVEQTFEVFVKNLDGKTHTIEVDKFEKVSTFKQKVGQKLGVAMEQQQLISQEGKNLADDNLSLHDYNIRKHSNLYCQGRLRGGGSQV